MRSITLATLMLAAPFANAAERDMQYINIIGSSDIIMIQNTGDTTLNLDGWRFCTQNSTSGPVMSEPDALNGISVPPNGSFIIRYDNDALPTLPTHHNASDIGPLAPFELDAYALSLYFPDASGQVDFNNPAQMGDHVQWMRNLVPDTFSPMCAQIAHDAGLWADAGEWIYVRIGTYLIELLDQTNAELHSPDDYNVIFECRADLSDDGVLDFFDVSAFVGFFGTQHPLADFTRDGNWDFFDVSGFLNSYSIGQCPNF